LISLTRPKQETCENNENKFEFQMPSQTFGVRVDWKAKF